jgi:diguanylate cyclase (GGDEF)-like protein/PAS domain S-box-containing protein
MLDSWPKHEIGIAACYGLTAAIALILTRFEGGIALMWPANALVAGMLIRSPRVRWLSMIALLFAAGMLTNAVAAHRDLRPAITLTCLNGVEIALMVWAFRRVVHYDYPDIRIDQSAVMTLILGVAIPGLVSLAAGGTLHTRLGLTFVDVASQWWSSHTLGACLVGPPVILWSTRALRRLVSSKYLVVNAAMLIGTLVGSWISIRYIRFPFVVISVLLLTAAFRVGGLGASLLSLGTSLTIAALWAIGVRPVGLERLPEHFSLVDLPVIALLATTMPPIAVGLGTDARRAVARKLHASERRFRESMEHSPIGMLIANLDGVWGYTNLALQRMLGYNADELRAFPPGGPSDPEELAATAVRQRLMQGAIDTYNGERRFLHKEGHWVWTHVAASMVRDEDGVPLYLTAQIENLEARRLAEARLAEERERLRITLMYIDDAVITTDARLRVSYINAAAESMLGLSKEAADGRLVHEVLYLTNPQTSKAAANLIGQSAIHAKVFRRESACILHRPDGSFCFIMDVVTPVLDSSGMVTGMVIVLRDASNEVNRAQDLTRRANHDALTGLHNRAAFNQRLTEIFGKCRVLDRPAALLAIDLDCFKTLNDTAGHAAGDAALLKVAEICRASVRASDMVARLGGDEFAIILDNCSSERATAVAKKVLQALNPVNIEWQGSAYSIGASIGVAPWEESMVSEQDWTAAADRACYSAKRGGRGQLQMESNARS